MSSSGHVAIGAQFFDIQESSLALVILLHLGTLLATVILFRRDIALLAAEGIAVLRDPGRCRTTAEGRALVDVLSRRAGRKVRIGTAVRGRPAR